VGGSEVDPDLAAVGIPSAIGHWTLTGSTVQLDDTWPLSGVVAAAGGDILDSGYVSVEATDGSEVFHFDALRLPGVTLKEFADGSANLIGQTGERVRSDSTVSGWSVVRFATPNDFAGKPSSVELAARDDLEIILLFGDTSNEALESLLAGW